MSVDDLPKQAIEAKRLGKLDHSLELYEKYFTEVPEWHAERGTHYRGLAKTALLLKNYRLAIGASICDVDYFSRWGGEQVEIAAQWLSTALIADGIETPEASFLYEMFDLTGFHEGLLSVWIKNRLVCASGAKYPPLTVPLPRIWNRLKPKAKDYLVGANRSFDLPRNSDFFSYIVGTLFLDSLGVDYFGVAYMESDLIGFTAGNRIVTPLTALSTDLIDEITSALPTRYDTNLAYLERFNMDDFAHSYALEAVGSRLRRRWEYFLLSDASCSVQSVVISRGINLQMYDESRRRGVSVPWGRWTRTLSLPIESVRFVFDTSE